MPSDCNTMASSPEVTCSPEATTASYSRASYAARRFVAVLLAGLEPPGLLDPGHKLVGLSGHGRNHHGASMTGVDLTLHVGRDVADAVNIGDGRPAEFEHQQGQPPLPSEASRCGRLQAIATNMAGPSGTGRQSGPYIADRRDALNLGAA